MKIFYSWQSDLCNSTNRGFIRKCLNKAIQELKLEDDISEAIREDIHIDQDTEGVPGSPDIAKTILDKIDRSAIFVADITPIKEIEVDGRKKSIPNPNVMLELGYALAKLGSERVILVLNDALWCGDVNMLPFDFRFRRISTRYTLGKDEEKAKKNEVKLQLVKSLKLAISSSPKLTEAIPSTATVFNYMKCSEADKAHWKTKDVGIQLSDYFDGAHDKRTNISNLAKAYMRIVPANWPNGIPKRAILRKEENRHKLIPFGDWSNMNYGPNDDGYLSYAISNNESVHNATQWFKDNGEVWGFDDTICNMRESGTRYLHHTYVVKCWKRFLNHIAYLRELGSSGPFSIEAGISNISGAIIQVSTHRNITCLEDDIVLKQETDGSPVSLNKYIKTIANELADAFGLEGENLFPELWPR